MNSALLKLFVRTFLFSALAGAAAARPAANAAAATEAPAKVFAEYYEDRLKLFPLEATLAGDDRYNDRLPNDLTPAYRAELSAFLKRWLARANALKKTRPTDQDQVSCDLLAWECQIGLEQLRFRTELLPINQFESRHLTIAQWAGGTAAQPFKTVRDYDNWLKRLTAFSDWCATARDNMKEGVRRGYVLPRALIEKVIPQVTDLTKLPLEENLFYSPIRQIPTSFSDADRQRLTTNYAAVLRTNLLPALQALSDYLRRDYLPAGRATSGISAVPHGREFYQVQIRAYTTTDLTPEQVFDLGAREVQRLLTEMEQVKQKVGYAGDLKSFFGFVRQKKELMPFTQPQQVLDNFNAIRRRMEPALARLFNVMPKTGFEVRRTEAFREASASAEYIQGSLDGTRPGIFYVPIPDVTNYNYYADEDLFLHEAIPGHHYQISVQQENTALPQFRRTSWYNAYGEGWALYCESLGRELGLYDDPYQYFGMLSAEMHRAIRLVVDSGLHAKGWTRERAIQYSLDHEAEPEASIIAEIERYMAWPGQALSYKVGQLKIRELRARAERRLGAQFDVRAFHRQILESGCLPLKLLEARLDRWIAAQSASRTLAPGPAAH